MIELALIGAAGLFVVGKAVAPKLAASASSSAPLASVSLLGGVKPAPALASVSLLGDIKPAPPSSAPPPVVATPPVTVAQIQTNAALAATQAAKQDTLILTKPGAALRSGKDLL